MATDKIKVAVLGGGMGAMSAAFALTEINRLQGDTFEITVHQLGWRLGGKTASGRNPQFGQRIEEHGLHVWSGMYDNSFTIMRLVYKVLNRPPGSKLATIEEAFERQNRPTIALPDGDGWSPFSPWFQPAADSALVPGRDSLWEKGDVIPSVAEMLMRLIEAIEGGYLKHITQVAGDGHKEVVSALRGVKGMEETTTKNVLAGQPPQTASELLQAILKAAKQLESDLVRPAALGALEFLVVAFRQVVRDFGRDRTIDRQVGILLTIIDLALTIILGIIDNDCVAEGLHVLDQYDFREFLRKYEHWLAAADHGSSLADSAIVTALYDYVFGYQGGSRNTPNLSACSAIQATFRIVVTYKGAFFYKATAGFGDTIFTPIYQVLKSRGVKFCFFHKVTGVVPSADGTTIEQVLIDEQAAPASGLKEYRPLVPVNGIECWPATTLWEQIQDGAKFAANKVNFEDYYTPQQPPAVALPPLQRGHDFDQVILGIPVGALDTICNQLIDQKRCWADMVSHMATVRTQSLQLWVDRDVRDLGGPFVARKDGPVVPPATKPTPEPLGPIVTGFVPPFDTYADMSQLLPAEAWPNPGPSSVAYFCSVMGDDEAPNDTKQATAKVESNASDWLKANLCVLWTDIGQGANFRWDLLHAERPANGKARLDQQYWRANISPSERYVLSLPKTLQYRMEPGSSSYRNLFLAGDWTKAPDINAGCVEVAAMSGLMAASALSGVPIPIVCANTLYGKAGPGLVAMRSATT